VHPPDLCPALHVDHPLLLTSISSDEEARLGIPADALADVAGGSVFDRREGVSIQAAPTTTISDRTEEGEDDA
jgi:hypothetical protein